MSERILTAAQTRALRENAIANRFPDLHDLFSEEPGVRFIEGDAERVIRILTPRLCDSHEALRAERDRMHALKDKYIDKWGATRTQLENAFFERDALAKRLEQAEKVVEAARELLTGPRLHRGITFEPFAAADERRLAEALSDYDKAAKP